MDLTIPIHVQNSSDKKTRFILSKILSNEQRDGTKKNIWRYTSSENFYSNTNDHYEYTNTE
ncbi:hypothetical protein MCO_00619 [Bartonella sp. DB5-6]|nr:hypothetical protein MCO_00619 [Bartonella sp. DB5-6]